jgi:hypothetical protein
VEVSGQLHPSSALLPGKEPAVSRLETVVEPRVGLDVVEKGRVSTHFQEEKRNESLIYKTLPVFGL